MKRFSQALNENMAGLSIFFIVHEVLLHWVCFLLNYPSVLRNDSENAWIQELKKGHSLILHHKSCLMHTVVIKKFGVLTLINYSNTVNNCSV